MEAMTTKRNQLRAQQLIQALKQRNMEASYAATKEEALEQALAWVPEGSCIGWGGSVSIDAIGLKDAVRILENIPDIAICRLTASDVVRHALVQQIIAAYEKGEKTQLPAQKKVYRKKFDR